MDFIIVGLGNPGKQYEKTRHNVGFMSLDYIAKDLNIKINKLKFKSLSQETVISGKKVLFLKPQTYMNNSGIAVYEAAEYYNVPIENILTLEDDVALPSNRLRIRKNGSHGGHNGLKSIINMLESENFTRIKIGVGDRIHPQIQLADWVTGALSASEMKGFTENLPNIYEAVLMIVNGETENAMAKFNKKDITNDKIL